MVDYLSDIFAVVVYGAYFITTKHPAQELFKTVAAFAMCSGVVSQHPQMIFAPASEYARVRWLKWGFTLN